MAPKRSAPVDRRISCASDPPRLVCLQTARTTRKNKLIQCVTSQPGARPPLNFVDAMLAGLARDGGLYVPKTWPRARCQDIAAFAGRPYAEVAVEVIRPFVGGSIADADLAAHGAARPTARSAIRRSRRWCNSAPMFVLELFHGPTLAFKDLAMQLLARLMDHVLRARRAHHHRVRHLGRYRRRRGRGLPRPRQVDSWCCSRTAASPRCSGA